MNSENWSTPPTSLDISKALKAVKDLRTEMYETIEILEKRIEIPSTPGVRIPSNDTLKNKKGVELHGRLTLLREICKEFETRAEDHQICMFRPDETGIIGRVELLRTRLREAADALLRDYFQIQP